MKPKVFFDYQIFTKQNIGGVSNYFFNLGLKMIEMNTEIKFFSPIHRNKYLTNFPKKNYLGYYANYIPGKANNLIDIINHFISKQYIRNTSYNLIHQTYYSKKNISKLPKVLTVFDMISEKYPNYFKNYQDIKDQKKISIENSQHLICISENTKNDLIKFFGVNPKKISVTLLASSISSEFIELEHKKLKNFILFIGNRRGYKNFEGLIKAFSKSEFLKKNFKIMVVGGEKFGKEDFQILKKNKLNTDHVFLVNEKDMSLTYIYSNVALMVYPSFYEGFGLPVLEAMSCGCPVLCSNGGSLPEVVGNEIYSFEPSDIDQMSCLIEKIILSNDTQKKIIEYGKNRVKQFSWDKCANQTLDIYKKLIL